MVYFLFTTRFPYEKGESFINNELSYVSKEDMIYIIPFNDSKAELAFLLPENCQIIVKTDFVIQLWRIIIRLFDKNHIKTFLSEIKQLMKNKNLHYLTFKRAAAYIFYATREELRIEKIIKKYTNDEPYVLYSYWASIYAIASVIKKNHLSYCICRMHGIDLYEDRHEYAYLPFRKFLFEREDMLCPVSESGKQYLINRYQNYFPVQKCYVSRLGTRDCGLNPFINRHEITIVSCSSIIKIKQVDLIWKALSDINQFEIKWIHFGDGELMKELKNELDNKENTRMQYKLMGHKDNEEIYTFYENECVDLFINVSQCEGIPVSIMEAISFGIPVIATDVGGTSEIVNNDTGWLLSLDNIIEELRMKVEMYYNIDFKEKVNKRIKARTFWENSFKADVNYKNFYNEIQDRMMKQNGGAF